MAVVWKKLAFATDVSTEIDEDIATHAALKAENAQLAHVMVEDGSAIDVDGSGKLTLGAHQGTHLPAGGDPITTAAPNAILEVQSQAVGTAESLAKSDHDHAIVHDITDNSLVTIDGTSNTPVDDDIAVFTALGLEGQTPAEVAATMALDDIGVPDALVDFNLQEAHKLVVQTVTNDTAKDALAAGVTALGQLLWVTADLDLWICTESS